MDNKYYQRTSKNIKIPRHAECFEFHPNLRSGKVLRTVKFSIPLCHLIRGKSIQKVKLDSPYKMDLVQILILNRLAIATNHFDKLLFYASIETSILNIKQKYLKLWF